jgi:two-component system, NtrC family, sensor histidine kinase HydH
MAERPEGAARKLPPELARLLHDLRGPLNSAVMHLEVLKRTVAEDPASAESLRTVLQQLVRLSEMLPAAFSVAALEAGTLGRVSLRTVSERARRESGLEGARLADGPWPDVHGDEALLAVAVSHLLRNAVEATPAGATAPEVSATRTGQGAVLAVRDWGTGLPTANPKLLVRLLHSTKSGHRGVGLVTAERVARLHGATLGFESLPDGARVTLVFPLEPPAG